METTVETAPGSPGLTMAQVDPGKIEIKIEEPLVGSERGAQPPYSDHDYTYSYKFTGQQPPVKAEVGSAWIEEDAPPMVSLVSSVPLTGDWCPHVVIVTAVITSS